MTKILYVYGGDYAALSFDNLVERGESTARGLWEAAALRGGMLEFDNGEDYFECEALEFGDIDPDFIKWVLDNQDYDESKHSRLYVVEEAA